MIQAPNLLDRITSRSVAFWFVCQPCKQISLFSFACQSCWQITLFWLVGVYFHVNFCHVILQLCPVFSTFVYPVNSISCLQNISAKTKWYILYYTILILILLLLIAISFFWCKKFYLYLFWSFSCHSFSSHSWQTVITSTS